MPENAVIPQATEERLASIGAADIVVGIPSYNNADTIPHVVRMAQAGLHKYFSSFRGLIVNSDGGSKDGTPERVMEGHSDDPELLQLPYPVYPVQKLTTPYHNVPNVTSKRNTPWKPPSTKPPSFS